LNPSLRIAAFGFRSFPPRAGAAGADKFIEELLPRLATRGHKVVAYNRIYAGEAKPAPGKVKGVEVIAVRTFRRSGIEALWHSAKATWDIIIHNRADIVHIQNGGNTPFAIILRLFGKKTFLSQDGKEWERGKWSAIGKSYLWCSMLLSAFVYNEVIFDNIFTREFFEKRFKRKYAFIPFGADVSYDPNSERILDKLGLTPGSYFLFVGRFIPDKGLHYLVAAYSRLNTDKQLVLIGGSPHPSEYEKSLLACKDPRVRFPGYVYGSEVHALMRNCYAYVQPSDIEGLSPVILESAYVGAPVICSDIEANQYALHEHGIYFAKSNPEDLAAKLEAALKDPIWLRAQGEAQRQYVEAQFSWDRVVEEHLRVFLNEGPDEVRLDERKSAPRTNR
jgi:glycosyltransferase involved in cell wall biosynthesis